MKTLIIPDIHTRWEKADYIVKRYPADKVVLLGDYFDNFDDSVEMNVNTAKWLIKFMNQEGHIALLGNHEFNYFHSRAICRCSGYTRKKSAAINKVLSLLDWNRLLPYYVSQGWYLTHAGISKSIGLHPIHGFDPIYFKNRVKLDLELLIHNGIWQKTYFRIGKSRGGFSEVGGITWCDFNRDFEPIEGLKQVFGHTPMKNPTNIGDNWCIDTHLNHVAIIENGLLQIVKV